MKVIGKTRDGYLVEATENELAHAGGYYWPRDAPGYSTHRGEFVLGTEINADKTHRWLYDLRQQEERCRSSAAFLRGMADMLDASMPTTIVPPPAVEKTE